MVDCAMPGLYRRYAHCRNNFALLLTDLIRCRYGSAPGTPDRRGCRRSSRISASDSIARVNRRGGSAQTIAPLLPARTALVRAISINDRGAIEEIDKVRERGEKGSWGPAPQASWDLALWTCSDSQSRTSPGEEERPARRVQGSSRRSSCVPADLIPSAGAK